jgi:hypothetical protein
MLNGETVGWERLEQWGFLPVLLVLAWLGSVCLLRPSAIVGFLQRQYSQ